MTEPFEQGASSDSSEHGRFLPGTVLARRYRIVGLLGKGGMGEVYRADDLKLGQAVALKLLPERLASDPKRLEYFHNEVRLARQVSHPNVCRVYDIGEVDGQHYLSMEYVDGEDLATLIRRIGRLPPDKGVDIARQLCAGLAAAHDRGVLHRDLKPANVMLDGRGRVRITDFGLARLTHEKGGTGVAAGTPAYMAPEQLAGREVTEQSDIYSLGLLLFEVFTGKPAFKADTPAELARLREGATPSAPSNIVADIDPAVERVILQCLEKEPRERPTSALAVSAALPGGDALAAVLAAGETPSPEMVAASGSASGLPAVVGVLCLAVLLGGLCAVAVLMQRLMVINNVPLNRKPEALEQTAKDIVGQLGYEELDEGDSVYRLEYDMGYLEHLANGPSSEIRDSLARGRPSAIHFWYRRSPLPLAPVEGLASDVSYDDPPRSLAGMVSVRLDPDGRLLEFHAVPQQMEKAEEGERKPVQSREVDRSELFELAGLDPNGFELWEGLRRPPPVFADDWACWHGKVAGHAVDVTAASLRGKPVYFQVAWPWTALRPIPRFRPLMPDDRFLSPPARTMWYALLLIICGAAVVLARRNARLGRTDPQGAMKTALYVFSLQMLIWLLGPGHSAEPATELTSFWTAALYAVFSGASFYFFYLALEPYVRRRWPEMLISWNRLLSGRFRDPRIGRDLLIGAMGGVGFAILRMLTMLACELSGTPITASAAMEQQPNILLGSGFLAVKFFSRQQWTLSFWLLFLVLLVLFTSLVRKQRLAVCLVAVLNGAMIGLNTGTFIGWVSGTILFGFAAYILIRYGLISAFAAWFSFMLLMHFPITTDFDAWYVGGSMFALGAVAALGVYGFYTSTAGRPLFGDRLAQS
ncbi:MAG: serine/threonine-protein kinase [Planctomycetota bacterium]